MELLPHQAHNVVEDEEWEMITADWWRTPFASVSWSYSPPKVAGLKRRRAKPPHYHGSLIRHTFEAGLVPSDVSHVNAQLDSEFHTVGGRDDLLNSDLVGVRGADGVVAPYEKAVGFYSSLSGFEDNSEIRKDLCADVDESCVSVNKQRWYELVEDLVGVIQMQQRVSFDDLLPPSDGRVDCIPFLDASPTPSYKTLHRNSSSIDLTDSDNSASMPSTPKATVSDVNVRIKNISPGSDAGLHDHSHLGRSSSRPLNASASSFVPLSFTPAKSNSVPFPTLDSPQAPVDTPSPSPTFVNFAFPSLNAPPLPTVKIKKDEQGFFYSETEDTQRSSPPVPPVTHRPSSTLLPPFLQEPTHKRKSHVSKTRAMVDRLRSSQEGLGPPPLGYGLGNGLGLGVKSKSATQSPSPSPAFNFFKSRLSVSEDGGDRTMTPSFKDDEDTSVEPNEAAEGISQDTKARRTRDLFLALTRRRSDSTPSELTRSEDSTRGERSTTDNDASSSSASVSPSLVSAASDGWIDGISSSPTNLVDETRPYYSSNASLPPKSGAQSSDARARVSSSTASSCPAPATSSTTYPSLTTAPPPLSPPAHLSRPTQPPGPYYYGPYTPMPMSYSTYIQMQMQLQLQMQMRIQMQGGASVPATGVSREWVPYLNPAAPNFVPPSLTPTGAPSSQPPTTSNMTTMNMNLAPAHGMRHLGMW